MKVISLSCQLPIKQTELEISKQGVLGIHTFDRIIQRTLCWNKEILSESPGTLKQGWHFIVVLGRTKEPDLSTLVLMSLGAG